MNSLIDSKFLAEFILYNNSVPMIQRENLVSEQISKLKNEDTNLKESKDKKSQSKGRSL